MFKVRPQDNVVLESCHGCFQTHYGWVKNADAPVMRQYVCLRLTYYAARNTLHDMILCFKWNGSNAEVVEIVDYH